LDAFARVSADFRQAVTPHPFGPFARAAMLTGLPSPVNGVRDYFDPLPPDRRTIAHELAEFGYETAYFGKWHLAARDPNVPLVGEAHAKTIVPPEGRGGFSYWEGFEGGFLLNDPWLHGSALPVPTQFAGHQSNVVCERAAGWIASRPDDARPWFCVVSVEPPHPPYGAPADGCPPADAAALVLRPNVPAGESAEKARAELAGYYAHIAATDRAIGRLLDTLSFDDTAVVVTSVHGDMHGAHGLFRKGWPHEESIRVPLLVRVPRAYGGQSWTGVRRELVSLTDLGVWARAWAAGDPAMAIDVAAQQISMPSVVRLPHQCDRSWRGVRTRVRKLVVTDGFNERNQPVMTPWLYFDLESDPWERINLATDPHRQSEIQALKAMIKLPAGT
jgi:arylsulfatase A-like enzyme